MDVQTEAAAHVLAETAGRESSVDADSAEALDDAFLWANDIEAFFVGEEDVEEGEEGEEEEERGREEESADEEGRVCESHVSMDCARTDCRGGRRRKTLSTLLSAG